MLGYRIKYLREKSNLSQQDVATGIISTIDMSLFENNKKEIPEEVLPLLADRLGVTLEELTEGTQQENEIEKTIDDTYNLIKKGQLSLANEMIVSLLSNNDIFRHEELRIRVLNLQTYYYLLSGNLDLAEENILMLKQSKIKDFPTTLYFQLLRYEGLFNFYKGKYTSSITKFKEALDLADTNNAFDIGLLYYNIALCYLNLRDDQKIIYYIQKAFTIFSDLGKIKNKAECLNLLGAYYYQQKQYDQAMEEYNKLLNILEEYDDESLRGKVLHNIALIYIAQNKVELAFSVFNQSLTIKRKIGDNIGIALTLLEIAKYHLKICDFLKFEQVIKELVELTDKYAYHIVQADMYKLLGEYHKLKENTDLYVEYFNKAIDIYLSNNQLYKAGHTCFDLAKGTNDLTLYKKSTELLVEYLDNAHN